MTPDPTSDRQFAHTPTGLPVEAAAPAIEQALATGSVIIRAEPGAGKSSLVPLLVAEALASRGPDGATRVIVTEPRRLAVRSTAGRLAELIDEPVGRRVGFTIRGERKMSADTQIEVVTEAVLTNRLHRDPELPGVGAVVFDEFHERSLHSDLGLGMCLESRAALRDDLTIVVMSATLEIEALARLLGGAPTVDVPGRTFPVETRHVRRPAPRQWTTATVEAAVEASNSITGDVLVFVPGRREIDDVVRGIRGAGDRLDHPVVALGLHGTTPLDEQRAILSGSSRKRIIVATSVAETSITVPGVEAVVDGGRLRRPAFDSTSGLGRLETGNVTQFAADQRRGRAGRLGPGICVRLWSADEERHLDVAVPPSIVNGDPLVVAFELARWGDPEAVDLPLLDRPDPERLASARRILRTLGLTDEDGRLTEGGRRAADLGLHPRLGALVLTAQEHGQEPLGLRVAALLDDERWPRHGDLEAELDERWRQLDRATQRLARRLDVSVSGPKPSLDELGPLLARAWPDRIAMARPGRPGRFLLSLGREVQFQPDDRLAGADFLVVAEADGAARAARIRRAVALDRSEILSTVEDRIVWQDHVEWDDRTDGLRAERRQQFGQLILHREPLDDPSPEAVQNGIRTGLRRRGLDALHWSDRAVALQHRLAWLHAEAPDAWPDVGDDWLLAHLEQWLDLERCRSPKDLGRLPVAQGLLGLLDWRRRAELDELAPTELTPPRGRARPVTYDSGRPVWSVRIQHLFGLDQHPTLGPNRSPVTVELLSPANRPAQVTTDLPGFWQGSYAAVRADLRGRYPKHDWPEDPSAG